jgi:tellurite resistance protein
LKKSRPQEPDIFVRPIAAARQTLDRHDVAAQADIAGLEPFMEASIAAAMIIAHADGTADRAEHRRIIALFQASPLLRGFSADDVAREIADHADAFERDHASALARAETHIRHADLSDSQFRGLIEVCVSVLEADGHRHPAEEQALAAIAALRGRN